MDFKKNYLNESVCAQSSALNLDGCISTYLCFYICYFPIFLYLYHWIIAFAWLILPIMFCHVKTDHLYLFFLDPILQHHRNKSHSLVSSVDGPDSDDLKDVEDL